MLKPNAVMKTSTSHMKHRLATANGWYHKKRLGFSWVFCFLDCVLVCKSKTSGFLHSLNNRRIMVVRHSHLNSFCSSRSRMKTSVERLKGLQCLKKDACHVSNTSSSLHRLTLRKVSSAPNLSTLMSPNGQLQSKTAECVKLMQIKVRLYRFYIRSR